MANEVKTAYEHGYAHAVKGGHRAQKGHTSYKIVTPEWKAWYAGYDDAVRDGQHPCLTANFDLRKGVARCNSV